MKLSRIMLLVKCAVIIAIFNSCGSIYYVPNAQNVPLLTKKDEAVLSANLAITEETSAVKLNGAYAFADQFGVIGSYSMIGERGEEIFPERKKRKANVYDVGLIYFLPFGKSFMPSGKKLVFETTFGYGGGTILNNADNVLTERVDFNNIYFQPALGYVTKRFELAFSVKYNYITYINLALRKNSPSYPLNRGYSFLEPAITIRYGWEKIKFQNQILISHEMSESNLSRDRVNINFGLFFKISGKSAN